MIGSEIEVYLNGILITKADVSKWKGDGDTPDGKKHPGLHAPKGRIGWLGHGHHVMWRNIRIKELPDNAKMGVVCPCQTKGVTTAEKFDNPKVRQAAPPEKRAEMQKVADEGMAAHWSVRNGNLFFDGFKGGYSLATKKDYKDFEMWVDWRIMSVQGDSGLYLRGAPQVQIWDANNDWGIGSGGLYNNKQNPDKALCIADRQVGDWNRFYIKMVGEKVTVRLNGALVVDNVTLENYWDRKQPIFPCEQIELQCHGDPIEFSSSATSSSGTCDRRTDTATRAGGGAGHAHRHRARVPGEDGRYAHPLPRGPRQRAVHDRVAVRFPRHAGGRARGGPRARRRADRERHRLPRRRHDHHAEARDPRPHDGRGHVGGRRDRHGRGGRPLLGGGGGDGALPRRP